MYYQFTRELIQLKDFRLKELIKDANKRWVAKLDPLHINNFCNQCNSKGHIHGRKPRVLRHQWIPGRRDLYVEIPVTRYRCPSCKRTWTPKFEGIPERGSVTEHFKSMVVTYCSGRTIQEVSNTVEEPYSNVERWYYEKAVSSLPEVKQSQAPQHLCMDEFSIRKGHTYGLALMDPVSGHIWHITEGKSRECIQKGLSNWPFTTSPKVVVTDLAPGMSDTVKQIWPKTEVVADKFHVFQLLTQAMDRSRKLTLGTQEKHKKIRYQRRLLMTHPKKLADDEIKKRDELLGCSSTLKDLYQALQELRDFYDAPSLEEGQKRFNNWINNYLFGKVSVLRSVAKTLLKWKACILNYFTYRLTNGPMEGTNNKIKVLKRRAYGYRNQERFFTRIRLECKQPA